MGEGDEVLRAFIIHMGLIPLSVMFTQSYIPEHTHLFLVPLVYMGHVEL